MLKNFFNIFKKNSEDLTEVSHKQPIKSKQKEIIKGDIGSVHEERKENELSDDEIRKFTQKVIENRVFQNQEHVSEFLEFAPSEIIDAAKIVEAFQQTSASLLQRKMRIGYNRATKLIDELESTGIIVPVYGTEARGETTTDLDRLNLYVRTITKFEYFKVNILPLHEEFIQLSVNARLKAIEIEEKNKLKEFLKQEILQKEKEKAEKFKTQQLKSEIREELIQEGLIINSNIKRRDPIPQDIQDRVWNRDGGKCVKCGSQEKIEFDHIIPFSRGGSNTYRNLQILCQQCNRQKSNTIG